MSSKIDSISKSSIFENNHINHDLINYFFICSIFSFRYLNRLSSACFYKYFHIPITSKEKFHYMWFRRFFLKFFKFIIQCYNSKRMKTQKNLPYLLIFILQKTLLPNLTFSNHFRQRLKKEFSLMYVIGRTFLFIQVKLVLLIFYLTSLLHTITS